RSDAGTISVWRRFVRQAWDQGPMSSAESVIPVVEEEVQIATRKVPTGRGRVETVTEIMDEIATAELNSSDVEITRVPVDREVDRAPEVQTVGDTIIVPVLEEVLVVERRLMLKEE